MPDFIDVSTEIRSGGALASDIGRTLLLSTIAAPTDYSDSATLRRQLGHTVYNSADNIHDSALEDAASVYFGQDPYPKSLIVGYRYSTAKVNIAIGTPVTSVSDIASLGDNAGNSLRINEVAGTAADGDFNSVTAFTGSSNDATEADNQLQILLRTFTGAAAATVTFDSTNNVFVLASASSFGSGFAGAVAEAFGLINAEIFTATAANESYGSALTRLDNRGSDFGWVVPATTITNAGGSADAIQAMGNWVNTRNKLMVFDSFGPATLTTNEDSSVGATISALKQNKVSAIYNGPSIDHKAVGYTALFSAVDYRGINTVRSGSHKQIQGTTANELTDAQVTELERKRINYYRKDGSLSYTREGWTFGTWMDVQAFGNWFNDAAQTEIYNVLSNSDIPQHDSDGSIRQALTTICELAIVNGALAPGNVSARTKGDIISVTGSNNFGGYLPSGYLIYAPSYANQSTADRNARKAVKHTVWMTARGFVNSVDIRAILQP